MTKTKVNFKKLISLITALMIVCSCIPIYAGQGMRARANDDPQVEIGRFTVGFDEGTADKQTDGSYVWTATTTAPGHMFIYYVDFELSGKDYFEPGEIEVIVPKRLLKNRADEYADEIELSVPSKDDVENYDGEILDDFNKFYYEIKGDQVVITNYLRFSAAETGYIELGYKTAQSSFEYQDMKISEDFAAEIRLYSGEEDHFLIDTESGTERGIGLNTSVSLNGTEKRSLNTINAYSYWQNRWGEKPENADDYYFVVWEIKNWVGYCTQPFDIIIDDQITQGEGEPIAYRFSGESTFTADNVRYNVRNNNYTNSYRVDYVITRHPKSVYRPLSTYTITNRETVTLHPIDDVDDDVSRFSRADFYHYTPAPAVFTAPGDYVHSEKRGNSNWWSYWPVADYGLQDLKDGPQNSGVDHLSGNIRFYVGTSTYLFSHTRMPDTDIENIENYGKRKINITLTDELNYLNDNIKIVEGKAVIDESERQLTYKDAEIEYITYSVGMKDGVKDEEHNTFAGTAVTYKPDDILTFYGKFNGGDWVQIAQYDLYRGRTANIDSNYVESMTSSKVVFKRGCTAYRITASNAHYSTDISASPYYRINRSEYVLAQSENVNRIKLTNISNLTVTDDNDNVVYDVDSMAHDYIIGVQKESTIAKDVAFTTSNPLKRIATIGWRVQINEHYMTNDGIVFVPQEEGVFYDLLPIGTMIDLQSIAIGIDYTDDFRAISYLEENDFEVSSVPNYKNSGRTLLVIKIKTQFTKALLTYNTTYSWDAAFDYGTNLLNTIAYETGNDKIGGGYPDDGGEIGDKEVMAGLDPDRSGKLFIYEQKRHAVRFIVSATTGLTKAVNNTLTTDFSKKTNVRQSSEYVYQIRYSTNVITRAKDIVIYDSLENYSDDDVHSDWHGTLLKDSSRDPVDLNQLKGKGIAPVVYYSDVDNLDIGIYHNVDSDMINNEKVWKTEEEFGDVTRARAVAIDLRKDKNGNDFILGEKDSVLINILMKSPDNDTTGKQDPVACNNIYVNDKVIDLFDNERAHFIHHDYTEVHFKIMGDVGIRKVDSSDTAVNIKGISFRLTGTSDYGTEYGYDNILTTDSKGRLKFKNIEKGSYTLSECAGSPDYLPIDHGIPVEIDESGSARINGMLINDGEYYDIPNDPRVHADIEFYKRDLLSPEKVIPGTKFQLQGTSYYFPERVDGVVFTQTADDSGKVVFKNIEWGKYTMREIDTPAEYALSKTVYDVRVDADGHAFVTVSKTEGDGDDNSLKYSNSTYNIYNEPLHSFTIQKESSTTGNPVRAVFRLTNQSTGVYVEKTTQSNGQILFDSLFSGEYWLQETEVLDENYNLDDTRYFVSIDKLGNVSIDGLSKNDEGRFVITNSPNGTVTVIKRWDDNETTQSRLEKNIEPVIRISSDVSENAAYFAADLTGVKAKNAMKSFAHFTGDDSVAFEKIENGEAVKVDDGKTRYYIYAWDNTGSGDIVWYSNAKTVYFTDTSRLMFNSCTNIQTIDMSGINTFLMQDMSQMFYNDYNLVNLNIKTLDTSWAKTMKEMFRECRSLQKITFGDGLDGTKDKFDTSQVTDMSCMFYNCNKLKKIEFGNSFNTSRVTTMSEMFRACSSLENIMGEDEDTAGLDVSGFDTSSVTSMYWMFTYCSKLEFIDVSGWDTSEVTSMESMFNGCTKLTNKGSVSAPEKTGLDLSHFNTEHVKYMQNMFNNCQSLEFIDLKSFDVSNVRDMNNMFRSANKLKTLDLSSFEPTCVTTMLEMFCGCQALESINFGDKFDVRSVITMQSMFNDCRKLERFEPGAAFVTSRVNNLYAMFYNCQKLKYVDLSSFDTGRVNNFDQMFQNCYWLENSDENTSIDVSRLDVSSAQTMKSMFENCTRLQRLDVSPWNTRMLKTPNRMFYGSSSLKELHLTSWKTDSMDNMSEMFRGCTALATVTFGNDFKADRVTSMWACFAGCSTLNNLDFSMFTPISLTGMSDTFSGCSSLESIDLSQFGIERRVSAPSLFNGCKQLTSINISNMRLAGDCNCMFKNCTNLTTLNISNIQTSNLSNAREMFNGCTKLTQLDLRRFDMFTVSDMNGMFAGCTALTSINITGWNTGYVSDMRSVFSNCTALTAITGIESLNTENVTYFGSMFRNCSKLTSLDLSSFNTVRATDYESMFNGCWNLKTIYVSDLWHCRFDRNYTFNNCPQLVGGAGTAYSVIQPVDGNYHKSRYAIIDDAENGNPGYLTRKPGTPQIAHPDGAYFRDNPIKSVIVSDPNNTNANPYFSGVRYFKHFEGPEADVDKTYRIDDRANNSYHIYGWVNSTDKTFYWWSDTQNVYLTNASKNLFNSWCYFYEIDTTGINTSLVSDFSSMFENCYNLQSLSVDEMDVSNAVTMANMFQRCQKLTSLDLSGWNTSKVRNMGYMFRYCYVLADLKFARDDGTTQFDTSSVTTMEYMFSDACALTELDLSMFRTQNVKNMDSMFRGYEKVMGLTSIIFNKTDGTTFDTSKVRNMSYMFAGCRNLTQLDLSLFDTNDVNNMAYMFYYCIALTELDVSSFDTRNVTNMSYMFASDTNTNYSMALTSIKLKKDGQVSTFLTPKVLTMVGMFQNCPKLTGLDLSDFDTSLVSDMQYMFYNDSGLETITFGDGFDTSRVQNMRDMFVRCRKILNTATETYCDFNRLDTSMVTDMTEMFYECTGMQYLDVSSWDVSKVVSMSGTFYACYAREITFTHWDASSVTSMYRMFMYCRYLGDDDANEKVLDLSDFKVASLQNMQEMFMYCERLRNIRFAQEDGTTLFDSSRVETMYNLFRNCIRLVSADLSGLDTSRTVDMTYLFCGCSELTEVRFVRRDGTTAVDMKRLRTLQDAFNGCYKLQIFDLSPFNTENVYNMQGLFAGCNAFTGELDVSCLDTSRVTNMYAMFYCNDYDSNQQPDNNLTSIKFKDNEGNTKFVTSKVTTMYQMFYKRNRLEGLDLSTFDFSRVTNMGETFRDCSYLKELIINDDADFSKVQNMSATFANAGRIETIDGETKVWLDELDMSNWDLSSVTTMSQMFYSARFKGLNFGENTNSIRNLNAYQMFYNCDFMPVLDLSGLNTEHVTTMQEMFWYCNNKFKSVVFTRPDGSTVFNTSKVTSMYQMFRECPELTSLDLSCFDTYNVTNMEYMFYNCKNLKSIEFGRLFTAEKVTTMRSMFESCSALEKLDLSHFDTGKVTNMRSMFEDCIKLNKLNFIREDGTSSFDTSKVSNMYYMFARIGSGGGQDFELDLSSFDTSAVTAMREMFTMRYVTNRLKKIYVSDKWSIESVTDGGGMFTHCWGLKGGKNTGYEDTHPNYDYAVIDDPDNDSPGYLSSKAAPQIVHDDDTGAAASPAAAVGVSYASTDDSVCRIEYRTDEIWVYTFYGIDNSVEYYAWEDQLENYFSEHMGQSRALEVDKAEYSEILNTTTVDPPTYGSLRIGKVLAVEDGAELTVTDEERQFVFTVTLKDQNGELLTGAARFGEAGFMNGTATVLLKGGESCLMEKIPTGYYYTVTEEEYTDFTTTHTGSAEGVIIADETAEVSFTNTKLLTEEETASFSLKKSVRGHYEDDSEAYQFIIELQGLHKNETYFTNAGTQFRTNANGAAEVDIRLKNGMSDTFTVPHGARFRITESGGTKYTSAYVVTVTEDDESFTDGYGQTDSVNTALRTSWYTADKDKLITVDYTNTRNIRQPLVLRKVVEGGSANSADTFGFSIVLNGLDPYERITTNIGNPQANDSGKLEINDIFLPADGEVIFYSLPVGALYQIIEAKSDYIASYKLTDEGGVSNYVSEQAANDAIRTKLSTEVETVNEGEEVTVTFTNTKISHDIAVKKVVDMTNGLIPESEYSQKKFRFTVYLSGLAAGAEYKVECATDIYHEETITAVEGTAQYEIYLKDGQSFKIKDLPINARYRIAESAEKNYIASFSVKSNETAVVSQLSGENCETDTELKTVEETIDPTDLEIIYTFKNTYSASDFELPESGLPDARPFAVAVLSGMLLFGVAYLLINRRRNAS